MRIRNYREVDLPALVDIQQLAAKADSTEAMSAAGFEEWLAQTPTIFSVKEQSIPRTGSEAPAAPY